MTEREQQRGGSGCIVGCLLMLVLLPPLYVLSIGPVALLALLATRNPSLNWLGVIYFPLGLLAEYSGPFRDVLMWYIELWTG